MKAKKILALALAGTMTLCCGITAFAGQSASTEGEGSSSGHLEREVVSVTFPTSLTAGIFSYTADPEELIAATGKTKAGADITPNAERIYFSNAAVAAADEVAASAAKRKLTGDNAGNVTGVTYTANDADKGGIYKYDGAKWKQGTYELAGTIAFTCSDGTYTAVDGDVICVSPKVAAVVAAGPTQSASSDKVKIINNSSTGINVSVNVKAAYDADNMAFVAQNAIASAETPSIYMALKTQQKGDAAETLTVMTTGTGDEADTTATKTISLAGVDENFEITQSENAYHYTKMDGILATDASWDYVEFGLTGECAKAVVTSDTKAPAINVSYGWSNPNGAEPTIAETASFATGSEDDLEIALTNATSVNTVKLGDTDLAETTDYTFADNKLTLKNDAIKSLEAGTYSLTLKASNADKTDESLTCVITVGDVPVIAETASFTEGTEDDLEIALTATSVSEVKLGDTDLTETTDYTFANNKLTLKNDAIKNLEANTYNLTLKATNAVATDKSLSCTITVSSADDYVMSASNNGYEYAFGSVPEGSLTALTIDGTARNGAITAGNANFAGGKLTFNSTMTANFGLDYGNHTIKATIGETEYPLTIANPVMTAADGGYSYTFESAPTGSFTDLTIDGTSRQGAIGAGNASYSDGVLTFNATMTTNMGLASGNHKINATIGGTVYKLYIAN